LSAARATRRCSRPPETLVSLDAGTYVPINGPAIGDLMHLFDFTKFRPNARAITPIVSDQDKDD
jgi:hypothetical protein